MHENMSTGAFLTIVAKDRIVSQFAFMVNEWPFNTWWTIVSTEKDKIAKEEIPSLMEKYEITHLCDYPAYFQGKH